MRDGDVSPCSAVDGCYYAFPSVTDWTSRSRIGAVIYHAYTHAGSGDAKTSIEYLESADSGSTWSASTVVHTANQVSDGYHVRDPGIEIDASNVATVNYFSRDVSTSPATRVWWRATSSDGASWAKSAVTVGGWSSDKMIAPGAAIWISATEYNPGYVKEDGVIGYYAEWFQVTGASSATWISSIATPSGSGYQWEEPDCIVLGERCSSLMGNATHVCTLRDDTRGPATACGLHSSVIYSAVTTDNGATWQTPAFEFNGASRATLLAMPDSRIIATYRDKDYLDSASDCGLVVYRQSHDCMQTWSAPRILSTGVSMYSDLIRLSDTSVGILYSQQEPGTVKASIYWKTLTGL